MFRVEAQHPNGYWFGVPSLEDQENLGLQVPAAEFQTLEEAVDFQAQEHKKALAETGIDLPFRIVEVKIVEREQYRGETRAGSLAVPDRCVQSVQPSELWRSWRRDRFQRRAHRHDRSSWMRAASRLLF